MQTNTPKSRTENRTPIAPQWLSRRALCGGLLVIVCFLRVQGADAAHLFLRGAQAEALLSAGATVLDARPRGFFGGHLPGAQPVDWLDFRDGPLRTGRLADDLQHIADKLQRLGVDSRRAVLVYGDAQHGFGEEARIAWMLVYLGHPQVHILDGGYAGWTREQRRTDWGLADRPRPSLGFVAAPQRAVRAAKPEVQRLVQVAASSSSPRPALILDVRSEREWHGATPYWEARGGRIPGAQHLFWQDLLDAQGYVRPRHELRARLLSAVAKVTSSAPASPAEASQSLVLYCTGGVRSAFAWAVLQEIWAGPVQNYDGSFWEWSADRALPVERDVPPASSPRQP